MIAHLKGIVQHKGVDHIIVDVQGVGYQVFVPLNTLYEIPPEEMEVSLHIYTHLREDHLSLYGFLKREEKEFFLKLLKVNGVGPKLALSLLSGLSLYEIAEAIVEGSPAKLKQIPGIGQKVAERIILDLKGKITLTSPFKKPKESGIYDEALSALNHLGYTRPQAEKALATLDWKSENLRLEEVIRRVLQSFARNF